MLIENNPQILPKAINATTINHSNLKNIMFNVVVTRKIKCTIVNIKKIVFEKQQILPQLESGT